MRRLRAGRLARFVLSFDEKVLPDPLLPTGMLTEMFPDPGLLPPLGLPPAQPQLKVSDTTAASTLAAAGPAKHSQPELAGTTASACPYCSNSSFKKADRAGRKSNQLLKWYSRYGYQVTVAMVSFCWPSIAIAI